MVETIEEFAARIKTIDNDCLKTWRQSARWANATEKIEAIDAETKSRRAVAKIARAERKANADPIIRHNPYANLPMIVRMDRIDDGGTCDSGGTNTCPHCGADGRYVYWFTCDDGSTRGAMKGCISKFKMHPFASMAANILQKEVEAKAKGRKLASWDVDIITAIDQYADGKITEDAAIAIIGSAEGRKRSYMRSKGY